MKRELGILSGLLLLACLVQAWVLAHATLPAPDAVEFVSVAQRLDRDGLGTTLREEPVPPLFPILVSLTHRALVQFGAIDASNWGASVQLAAAWPLVLAVIPVYLLLNRSVPRSAAIVGTVFFVLLPEVSHLAADGLSDSTALALFCLATWAAAMCFRESMPPQPAWLLLSGAIIGFALTTRVESIVIPVSVVIALVASNLVSRDASAERVPRAVACLVCGLALVLVPYLWASETLAPDAAWSRVLGRRAASESLPLNASAALLSTNAVDATWQLADGRPMVFGRKDTSSSTRFHGLSATLSEFISELSESFAVVVGLAALYGLWCSRGSGWRRVDVLLTVLAVVFTLCVLTVAAKSGYLAGRHLLPLVVLGLPWAGLGVLEGGRRIDEDPNCIIHDAVVDWMLRWSPTVAVAAVCVVLTVKPSFSVREHDYCRAVDWLQDQPEGAVLDSAGFTALYSGRKTYRYDAARVAFIDPALKYVIVESTELNAESDRGQSMRLLMSSYATRAGNFNNFDFEHGGTRNVVVFYWDPQKKRDHDRHRDLPPLMPLPPPQSLQVQAQGTIYAR